MSKDNCFIFKPSLNHVRYTYKQKHKNSHFLPVKSSQYKLIILTLDINNTMIKAVNRKATYREL